MYPFASRRALLCLALVSVIRLPAVADNAPPAGADPAVANLMPAQPKIPQRSFQLTDFGAVPNQAAPTDLFSKAIAAVAAAGGGTLNVPAGVWFSLPVDLCSNLNLHLEDGAKILFAPDHAIYRIEGPKEAYRPLLHGSHLHDVEISGTGTIDGYGSSWWPDAFKFKYEANAKHLKSNTSPRPRMVQFDDCERVRVENVLLTNSPVFNLVPNRCNDVTVDHIRIYNPTRQSPNTDGIDPSVSNRVLITHCTIDTDDDNIAVKAGGSEVMHDVLITDCTFLHGHGCSIGSETSSGLKNMLVQRCTFTDTDTGVRFKSDRKRGGLVDGVTYTDLTMERVEVAISLTSYYMGTTTDMKEGGASVPVTATTPIWRNIVIRNVKASNGTKTAGMIVGLPEMKADAILLQNVQIAAPKGLTLQDVDHIVFDHVKLSVSEGPGVIKDETVLHPITIN